MLCKLNILSPEWWVKLPMKYAMDYIEVKLLSSLKLENETESRKRGAFVVVCWYAILPALSWPSLSYLSRVIPLSLIIFDPLTELYDHTHVTHTCICTHRHTHTGMHAQAHTGMHEQAHTQGSVTFFKLSDSRVRPKPLIRAVVFLKHREKQAVQ